MNIVFVKHHENDQKTYCFSVASQYAKTLKKGDLVLCQTRRGIQPGILATGVISGDGAVDIARNHGATFPLKKILSPTSTMRVADIKIPHYIKKTIPSGQKIEKRIREYMKTGNFQTNIVVGANGYLTDGYTAYLAAKLLDLETLQAKN